MEEGWCEKVYWVFFSEHESDEKTRRYKLSLYLPGYRIIGLIDWDDFLVIDPAGNAFAVPTVPMGLEYLRPYTVPVALSLTADERYEGKIKWYIKPIVFGGYPKVGENLSWVNHDQHIELVTWWNERYRAVAKGAGAPPRA